jgi:hypothetical protein
VTLNHEGVTLVLRVLLIAAMGLVAGIFRTLIGPGQGRGFMLAGTLGGITFGIVLAPLVGRWINADVSVLCACVGVVLGWTVAWLMARRVHRGLP